MNAEGGMGDATMMPLALRRALAAIFLMGSLGTAAELALLGHFEHILQRTPLVLIGLGCAVLALVAIRPSSSGVRVLQLTMIAFMVSGIAGIVLHYGSNAELELELQPEASGFGLFWEAMQGGTPALAPGTMILLGAVGLTYTYRHPAVSTSTVDAARFL